MTPVTPLSPADLYRACDPAHLGFETTSEVAPLDEIVGQPRAVEAVRFGVRIPQDGFNIYALGPTGTGKFTLVRRSLEEQAAQKPSPPDWCYVYNFESPYRPKVLRLPPGTGAQLRQDMQQLIADLRSALSAAFESDEYQTRREVIQQEFMERQQKAFTELQEKAQQRGLTLLRTPAGFVFAPVRLGQVLSPEEFQRLPPEERERITANIQAMQEELQRVLHQMPRWQRELRQKLMELDREVAGYTVRPLVEELRQKYSHLEEVVAYLNAVEADIVANAMLFLQPEVPPGVPPAVAALQQQMPGAPLRRYEVNVLVDHSKATGAPVVYEDNPTYQNLIGRIEHMAHMGMLLTDFTLIKPGALHRANGGYLILDAHRVLQHPLAWEGLKRALQSRQLRIEAPLQTLGLFSTVSLEPEPIPLDVKVVLIGSPLLYYLLYYYEEDFQKLFKVKADFATQMDRTPETEYQYALFVRTICQEDGLLPFDRGAVAQVIEHSSRLVEDQYKLSTRFGEIADLVREASFWASRNGHSVVTADDVRRAIEEKTFRSNLLEERIKELITQGTVMIDTTGERVGQINGLSVILLGDYTFGRPSRVTANTFVGKAGVVNIEREVELSGPIHSKGVLILSSYLGRKYAQNAPLTLSASLVFEQSYEGVEGDSASSTELYAILSSLSGYPIKQGIAVTGSVNQHGELQPVGGINEKIEGFFDICKAKGLTGDQGVIIPVGNVRNLMLREDVIEAVREGEFHIWPVRTVDEGIEILTGVPAGELQEDGTYPEGTVNWAVSQRLAELAEELRRATRREGEEEERASSSASEAEGEDEEGDEP